MPLPESLILPAVLGGLLLLAAAVAVAWGLRRAKTGFEAGAASREAELATLRAERAADQSRLAELRAELHAAREAELALRTAAAAAAREQSRVETELRAHAAALAEIDPLRARCEVLRGEQAQLAAALAESRAQLEAARQLAEERAAALAQVGAQMKLEFEALSNRILDEKARKFTEANQTQMGALLTPLREQLDGFRRTVAETWEREQRERVGLKHELEQLKTLNQRLGDEATALTRALKGEQRVQGRWGEMLLERLLEASGLEPGRGFELQVSVQGEEGRQRPDAIVHLPEERDLVIDAKVSLTAWERWCAATDDATRALEMRAHLGSLRAHVAGLSARNYAELPGVHSVDFVLMFVPVEAALLEALRADDALYVEALERNVVIVSTSTLLATLRTVASVWRNEDRNRNALEIARRAGRLYDKFHGLMADFDKVDRNLRIARESFDDARAKLSTGKGNVVSQLDALHRLGARAQKRLDRELREQAGAEDDGNDDELPAITPPPPA